MGFRYDTGAIRKIESLSNVEVVGRIVSRAGGCAGLAAGGEVAARTLWVWFAVYLSLVAIGLALAPRLPPVIGPGLVACVAGLTALQLACVLGLAGWLWTEPSEATHVVALAILAGAILNTLAVREVDPLLRYVDGVGIFALLLFMPLWEWWSDGAGPQLPIIAAATGLLGLYYVYGVRSIRKVRLEALRSSRQRGEAAHAVAMGRMASGMAHDFNNMLTAVLGNLELRHEIADPVEREALFGEAEAAARRAVKEIGQIMAYARQARLVPQTIAAADLREALPRVGDRVRDPGITVSVTTDSNLPAVHADPLAFEAGLTALVANAREAMPRGGILRIRARALWLEASELPPEDGALAAGRYLQVAVEDTGEGIPEHLLDRVAEPFFTTKPAGTHSGLGLSMAKGFAEQSGGGITIGSTPRRGTTVALYLPATG